MMDGDSINYSDEIVGFYNILFSRLPPNCENLWNMALRLWEIDEWAKGQFYQSVLRQSQHKKGEIV
jgi:hypothetical protein